MPATTDLTTLTDDELQEALGDLSEQYGETKAQADSEIALVGDAWPGAALDLAELRTAANEYAAEWERRHPQAPAPVPEPAPAGIPFDLQTMPF